MKSMLRRDLILMKRGAIPALILTVLLLAFCTAAAFSVLKSAEEHAASVKTALVDKEDSLISRMALNLVEQQSFIRELMSFESVSEDDAVRGIREGLYAAAIILPEDFPSAIRAGRPAEGRIILSDAAAASAEIVSSAARFGELLLAAGQNGVFAGEDLILEHDLDQKLHSSFLAKSNAALLNEALTVYGNRFTVEVLPYAGTGLGTAAYCAACWSVLVLLLCGLFFSGLYTADCSRPLLSRLYASGITPRDFLAGKILWPFLFRLILFTAVFCGLNRLLPLSAAPGAWPSAAGAILLASVFTAGLFIALPDKASGAAVLLALSSAGLLLTGGLIPRSMLPDTLLSFGRFTPSGALLAMLSPLFGGASDLWSVLAGMLYAGAALALALRRLTRLPLKGGKMT